MHNISFTRHRFPPDLIRHAVWLYARFTLSYRDLEDLLAQRFLNIQFSAYNTFYIQRHLLKRGTFKQLRSTAFSVWMSASAAA